MMILTLKSSFFLTKRMVLQKKANFFSGSKKNVFFCRTTRLGNKGIVEVQNHLFFKNDVWDFSNIRDCVPPLDLTTELSGEWKFYNHPRIDKTRLKTGL